LDGGDVVTSDAGPVVYVRWLPDGRRVVASAKGRVLVVDAATGKATDLAPDEPDGRFIGPPKLSPDRRFAVWWRKERHGHVQNLAPAAFTVFDLDRGTRSDVGPAEPEEIRGWWGGGSFTAWWSPKGELYACVGAPRAADEAPGSRWRLVRWSPQ